MNRRRYEFKAAAGNSEEVECFLYDQVGFDGITAAKFINDLQKLPQNKRLVLRIHSPGGSLLDGQAIFTALKSWPGGVTTKIDGLAASMASVIAIAGSPVLMAANGVIMIHNVSSIAAGDAEEMRKSADILDKLQETIVAAYVNKTKLPRARIVEMLNAETWMGAAEAKQLGFVDQITGELAVDASEWDLSQFKGFLAFKAKCEAEDPDPPYTVLASPAVGGAQIDVTEVSALGQLRKRLSATSDPETRVRLSRRIRELRGTILQIAATLPDSKSVQTRIQQTNDPRQKAILARYARKLRTNQTNPDQKNEK